MSTKSNPTIFDCYANAAPDEPIFVILARDKSAPVIVRAWANERIALGLNKSYDQQITEAIKCAHAMYVWRKIHRP